MRVLVDLLSRERAAPDVVERVVERARESVADLDSLVSAAQSDAGALRYPAIARLVGEHSSNLRMLELVAPVLPSDAWGAVIEGVARRGIPSSFLRTVHARESTGARVDVDLIAEMLAHPDARPEDRASLISLIADAYSESRESESPEVDRPRSPRRP